MGISTAPSPASMLNADLVGRGDAAGEIALSVDRLARPDPDLVADEAPEVLGLGQRAVRARRGDLERVVAAGRGAAR